MSGCDTTQCGACVVHVDGKAVKSCTTFALQVRRRQRHHHRRPRRADGQLHPMQEAFRENHGLQCGFCTPGMIMSAVDIVQPQGQRSRRARPSATSSKATSAAAPATTTSSRRSRRAPRPWRSAANNASATTRNQGSIACTNSTITARRRSAGGELLATTAKTPSSSPAAMTLIPTMKLRLAAPSRAHRSVADRRHLAASR